MSSDTKACLEDAVPDDVLEPVAPVGADVPTAAPEHSAPGESASNGLAERAVQSVEGQVRTMKLALQDRNRCGISSDQPIMHWMVMHAAFLLTVYVTCASKCTCVLGILQCDGLLGLCRSGSNGTCCI